MDKTGKVIWFVPEEYRIKLEDIINEVRGFRNTDALYDLVDLLKEHYVRLEKEVNLCYLLNEAQEAAHFPLEDPSV